MTKQEKQKMYAIAMDCHVTEPGDDPDIDNPQINEDDPVVCIALGLFTEFKDAEKVANSRNKRFKKEHHDDWDPYSVVTMEVKK